MLYIQWNPDFSNLLGKRILVRKIGSSKNRRWHEITLSRLIYEVSFYNNRGNKQKYHEALKKCCSFHLDGHT